MPGATYSASELQAIRDLQSRTASLGSFAGRTHAGHDTTPVEASERAVARRAQQWRKHRRRQAPGADE